MKVIIHPFTQKASSFSSQFGDGMRDTVWPVKLSIVAEVSQMFIRPKSHHYLSLSLTHLLTHWRTDSRLLNLVPTAWWCRSSYLKLLTSVKSYLKLGENTSKSKVFLKIPISLSPNQSHSGATETMLQVFFSIYWQDQNIASEVREKVKYYFNPYISSLKVID